MTVEILQRGRFVELPDATARHLRANVWEVCVPRTDDVARVLHQNVTLEAFEGAVLALDEEEAEQVVPSGETGEQVVLTALMPG